MHEFAFLLKQLKRVSEIVGRHGHRVGLAVAAFA